MDVQQASIAIAYVAPDQGAEGVSLGTIGTRQGAIDKRIRQLPSTRKQLVFISAAGPCGYGLYRALKKNGDGCGVVAPSWMPTQAGDRGNPDRRAAMHLARRLRAGDLTPVSVPAVDDAAIRALRRARAETLHALKAAPLRLTAFVLRPALRSTGQANGSPAHLRGLRAVVWPPPAPPLVLQDYVHTGTAQTARLHRLACALHEPVHPWRWAPVVEALQALRGGPGPGAVPTGADRGALTRFAPPRQRRHALGRRPSDASSGARRPQGSRTKTGKSHARRARVAGAGAYR